MRIGGRIESVGLVLSLLLLTFSVLAQDDGSRWLRVMTDEYLLVEVDRTSLRVGSDNSLIAVFRTTITRSENDALNFISGKASLDTVEFSIKNRQYRVLESRQIDQRDKQRSSAAVDGSSAWRSCLGRACTNMAGAARQLNPFGAWQITGYRYATGQPGQPDDPEELKALKGAAVSFQVGSIVVNNKSCKVSDFLMAELSRKMSGEHSSALRYRNSNGAPRNSARSGFSADRRTVRPSGTSF